MIKNTIIKKENSITFKVEELDIAEELLEESSIDDIFLKFSNTILTHSLKDETLISNGFHSFIYGMYQAYMQHRPFILSPDIMWLVICQGVSSHVKFGKGTENDVFPQLNTKQIIEIEREEGLMKNRYIDWEKNIKQFTSYIENHIGKELTESLRANFSTTGSVERIVSEITILDTMKPYFELIESKSVCGIPEITLEGTVEDWEKILIKLSKLRRYNLDWWIDKLEPILNHFVLARKGEIDKEFWKDMFKINGGRGCMNGEFVDGWITNFYPYDRTGNLMKFKKFEELSDYEKIISIPFKKICEDLPKEIICVDFVSKIKNEHNEIVKRENLEYWAGFIGLKQDDETLALRPQIGWFVCQKDISVITESKDADHKFESRKYYNLKSFPRDLLVQSKWPKLNLHFTHEIELPEEILDLSIKFLKITGILKESDKKKLSILLEKGTVIWLNDEFIEK